MSKRSDRTAPPAPYRYPDHPKPVTRRQFLAQGFLSGAAWIAAPSLLGLFKSQEARAQAVVECGLGAAGGKLPFLVFDLGGGASIAGSNVLVGTNTQLDPLSAEGYVKMGLPTDRTPADPAFVADISDTVTNDPLILPGDPGFGLAFHSESALLRGIRMRASDSTLQRVNGCIFCARSDNDTGNNPHNPIYGINAAGADGALLALVGTESSDSGGRSDVPTSMFDPTVRPTRTASPSDARGLIDTGKLVELLDDPADAAAVMAAAESISGAKLAKLPETDLVKSLVDCAYQETTDLVGSFGDPDIIDPTLDPQVTSVVSPGDFDVSELRKSATVAKLVLDSFAGAGTIEFGGYDYHDGTRATGERKDQIAGEAIGTALEIAANKGRPLVIYLLSDGSVSSDGAADNSADGDGKLVWRGDSSSTAATVMLVFDPDGRPGLTATGNQIGTYRSTGSVETDGSLIGDNVTALAYAVVLNYLALHNEVGEMSSVAPGSPLGTSAAALDPLTAFAPLARFP
jgi:hypothetical protein